MISTSTRQSFRRALRAIRKGNKHDPKRLMEAEANLRELRAIDMHGDVLADRAYEHITYPGSTGLSPNVDKLREALE